MDEKAYLNDPELLLGLITKYLAEVGGHVPENMVVVDYYHDGRVFTEYQDSEGNLANVEFTVDKTGEALYEVAILPTDFYVMGLIPAELGLPDKEIDLGDGVSDEFHCSRCEMHTRTIHYAGMSTQMKVLRSIYRWGDRFNMVKEDTQDRLKFWYTKEVVLGAFLDSTAKHQARQLMSGIGGTTWDEVLAHVVEEADETSEAEGKSVEQCIDEFLAQVSKDLGLKEVAL